MLGMLGPDIHARLWSDNKIAASILQATYLRTQAPTGPMLELTVSPACPAWRVWDLLSAGPGSPYTTGPTRYQLVWFFPGKWYFVDLASFNRLPKAELVPASNSRKNDTGGPWVTLGSSKGYGLTP